MGIPKNYQNKVNLENRVKALNEVNFYMVKCEYTPKEGDDKVTSTIEVNALNEEQMEKKFGKWKPTGWTGLKIAYPEKTDELIEMMD